MSAYEQPLNRRDYGTNRKTQPFRQMTVSEHDIHYLEIVTPDAEASCDFYSQTYGWRFEKMLRVTLNTGLAGYLLFQ